MMERESEGKREWTMKKNRKAIEQFEGAHIQMTYSQILVRESKIC